MDRLAVPYSLVVALVFGALPGGCTTTDEEPTEKTSDQRENDTSKDDSVAGESAGSSKRSPDAGKTS